MKERYKQKREHNTGHSFQEKQTLCSLPLCLGYKQIKEHVQLQQEMNLRKPGLLSEGKKNIIGIITAIQFSSSKQSHTASK